MALPDSSRSTRSAPSRVTRQASRRRAAAAAASTAPPVLGDSPDGRSGKTSALPALALGGNHAAAAQDGPEGARRRGKKRAAESSSESLRATMESFAECSSCTHTCMNALECSNGHVIHRDCWRMLAKPRSCPRGSCGVDLDNAGPARRFAKIARQILRDCPSCDVHADNADVFQQHLDMCPERSFFCPLSTMAEPCTVRQPLPKLVEHLVKTHKCTRTTVAPDQRTRIYASIPRRYPTRLRPLVVVLANPQYSGPPPALASQRDPLAEPEFVYTLLDIHVNDKRFVQATVRYLGAPATAGRRVAYAIRFLLRDKGLLSYRAIAPAVLEERAEALFKQMRCVSARFDEVDDGRSDESDASGDEEDDDDAEDDDDEEAQAERVLAIDLVLRVLPSAQQQASAPAAAPAASASAAAPAASASATAPAIAASAVAAADAADPPPPPAAAASAEQPAPAEPRRGRSARRTVRPRGAPLGQS